MKMQTSRFTFPTIAAGVMALCSCAPLPQHQAQPPSGTWKGNIVQAGPGSYRAEYPVSVALNGLHGGTIEYPTLGCGGILEFNGMQGVSGVYRERITYTRAVRCVDNGRVVVTSDGLRAVLKWDSPGITATAMLSATESQSRPASDAKGVSAATPPATAQTRPAEGTTKKVQSAAESQRPSAKGKTDPSTAPRISESSRIKSVSEAREAVLTSAREVSSNCYSGLPTTISRVRLLNATEWRKLSQQRQVVNNAVYLIQYGTVKKKESWTMYGPIVPSATVKDFAEVVGKPICLEDPDVDHF